MAGATALVEAGGADAGGGDIGALVDWPVVVVAGALDAVWLPR